MEDPIVLEVRKVREELAIEANYDLSTLFDIVKEDVEKIEQEYGIKWKRVIRKNDNFVNVD